MHACVCVCLYAYMFVSVSKDLKTDLLRHSAQLMTIPSMLQRCEMELMEQSNKTLERRKRDKVRERARWRQRKEREKKREGGRESFLNQDTDSTITSTHIRGPAQHTHICIQTQGLTCH